MSLRERRSHSDSKNLGSSGGVAPAPGGSPSGAGGGYAGYGGYTMAQSPTSQTSAQYGSYGTTAAGYGAAHQSAPAQQPAHYGGYPQSGSGGGGGGLDIGYGASSYGYSRSSSTLSGDETKNPRGKRRPGHGGSAASSSLAWQLTVILAVTTVALFAATLHYRSRYTHHKRHAHHQTNLHERKIQEHAEHRSRVEDELDAKVKHVTFLEDRVGELQKELDQFKDMAKMGSDRMSKREEALQGRMINMIGRIQKESHRSMVDRFGPGPYQVEMQIELPANIGDDQSQQVPENPTILINLFHEDLPHATHVFLEQVAHKLWDDCAFYINTEHVLQVGPVDAVTGEDRMPKFVEKELDILSFQEYSFEHPHQQYTVGFTGRPAGPGFYINKLDNSKDHGPGGQMHHDLNEEADPCFGKIDDSSIEIADLMFGMPVDKKDGLKKQWLTERLRITSAKIVGWVDPNDASATQAHIEKDAHKMNDAIKKAEAVVDDNPAAVEEKPEEKPKEEPEDTPEEKPEEKPKEEPEETPKEKPEEKPIESLDDAQKKIADLEKKLQAAGL